MQGNEQKSAALQSRIAAELGVAAQFDPQAEIERRIAFLADYLTRTGRKGYVLGISGGDDTQREIIAALHVAPVFDAARELERRVDFLAG